MIEFSEVRWTPPRRDCPHPEFWHSVDDESSEVEITELVAAFVRALQPELVVETGTAFGQTALAIGRALQANGHGRLDSLEPDCDRAAIARERVSDLPVRILEQPSLTYAAPDRIDFAWIDSLLALRVPELYHLRAWLRPGSIVGVHDAGPQHGIRQSVESVSWIRWLYLPTPRGVLFGEVRR